MRIDRLFDKNYYKHKEHKYLKRESLGGYDLVKNPKTGKKTRRYRYKYTYPRVAVRDSHTNSSSSRVSVNKYIKMRDELRRTVLQRETNGLVNPTKAMRLKQEKINKLYNQLSLRDRRLIEYSEAISKLRSMQAIQLYQSRPYKHLLRSQEDHVLEIAEKLGLYHPKTKFWFKLSNQKLLIDLKIDRNV